ncbi:MAG: hypothetical protein ACOC8X_12605 [Chloroflexota bacterium]
MISLTTARFWKAYNHLDESVQKQAREAYKLFDQNPYHPSLHFKKVHPNRPVYSVRISLSYRALAVWEGEQVIWFWIGSHDDYDKLLRQL